MFDRLEASGIIDGWDRADWKIRTTRVGLDIRITPADHVLDALAARARAEAEAIRAEAEANRAEAEARHAELRPDPRSPRPAPPARLRASPALNPGNPEPGRRIAGHVQLVPRFIPVRTGEAETRGHPCRGPRREPLADG